MRNTRTTLRIFQIRDSPVIPHGGKIPSNFKRASRSARLTRAGSPLAAFSYRIASLCRPTAESIGDEMATFHLRLGADTIAATLSLDGDAIWVQAESGADGVLVNGSRIRERTLLATGDRITFENVELVVAYPRDAQIARDTDTLDCRAADPAELSLLSKRERQVFAMIARGMSNVEVSEALSLSPKTVATYRARLSHKLGVHSRSGMVDIALRTGMLSGG
jgi:DNA-binding CsgD family transcriptional regulator